MLPTGLALFCAYFAFLRIPSSRVEGGGGGMKGGEKKVVSLRYPPLLLIRRKFRRSRQPFSLYFSFRSVKRRDFPGNVSSGGCDSLLLVLALTSKQHDSLLGYALRFLYIRSCRLCRRCTTGLFCLLMKKGKKKGQGGAIFLRLLKTQSDESALSAEPDLETARIHRCLLRFICELLPRSHPHQRP